MESERCRVGRQRWLGNYPMRLAGAAGRVLFPHFCLACGTEGKLLCSHCEARYALNKGILFSLGKDTRCFSAGRYADPVMRGLLHLYKYGRVMEAGDILVRLAVGCAGRQSTAVLSGLEGPLVVPLPMNPINQALRGFNQTFLIAKALSEDFELELAENSVRRRLSWKPQAHLSGLTKRQINVQNAFYLGDNLLVGRDVILVDDVFTTGATVRSCTKVLRGAGVANITIFTALKG